MEGASFDIFGDQSLADPAQDSEVYKKFKEALKGECNLQSQHKIDQLKDQKKKKNEFINHAKFDQKMDETFNKLELAFKDLQKQNNQDIILSIDRFFAREIIVKVLIEE